MPHALNDFSGGAMDEDGAALQYFNEHGEVDAAANGFAEREIDQRDKDADAIDYEDFDDDELPEEEEASGDHEDGEERVNGLHMPNTNGFGQTNGHYDHHEPGSDDLFGAEEGNDLFGEHTSSPEQARQPPEHDRPQPQHRPSGLALPGKSALALPGFSRPSQPAQRAYPQALSRASASMSPPSLQSDGYSPEASPELPSEDEDEFAGLDDMERAQRMLMAQSKRRQAGERVEDTDVHVSPSEFYNFFPAYETSQNPRFIEFFPQRPVQYRGKVPAKPPKALQPTKLTLDIMQDQERSFKSNAIGTQGQESTLESTLIHLRRGITAGDESDDDLALSTFGEGEVVGGVTMADLAVICEDWGMPSLSSSPEIEPTDLSMDGEWATEEQARPRKRRKLDVLDADIGMAAAGLWPSFEEPERAAAKIAKNVTLDLNDPLLLVDEHAPQIARKAKRMPGDNRRDAALSRDLAKRYNISNDEAYDLLKENHQHKVRSTLGNMAVEHSLPATKLQFPLYKVALDPKTKRSFHRPSLHIKDWETKPQKEFRITKLKTIKKKERRGREIKELFATAESLALNDNSNMLLLEYTEEAPFMLSNFGMGNRLINFYRKRGADDQERPKRDVGETQVLLTQDKSPFANFGHVDQGEIVSTLQNGLFRAPVYQHATRPTDFFVGVSSTQSYGSKMYLRNMENLHIVGQQLPSSEVPGEHSRRVTDAAKKRLRALAYRIYTKAQNPARRDKTLDNATLMRHLKGHDMPQTRSKMREFMKYERNARGEGGVWVPLQGQVVPDAVTLRSWVRPEDVCLLDSMQVGVQRLNDLGLGSKDEEEKEIDENANIEKHLAPWRATKTFLQATQGKAMLKLHGEGDPTGRGEAISFVKISMKGGYQRIGESVEDKLDAKKRRENGGHTYNVAKQQGAYEDDIRRIWDKQKIALSSKAEHSDDDMDDEDDFEADAFGRAATPRSSFVGTPAKRGDDETGTQFSRASTDRVNGKVLIIKRTGGRDAYGQESDVTEKITNPKVIKEYIRRTNEKKLASVDIYNYIPTGDKVMDTLVANAMIEEKSRIEKNVERRQARERAKGKGPAAGPTNGIANGNRAAGSPPASTAGSPGPSELDTSTLNGPAGGSSATATPQKGRGRNKDGTARKCANCGQVGHIKTNRKSVGTGSFSCLICDTRETIDLQTMLPISAAGAARANGGGLRRSAVSAVPRATAAADATGVFATDTSSRLVL
ncbi:hypothetical protein LTR86_005329 [Recurvomyces mirabilis]|nr:hypothetical protein LTR86_005329 [Recurvomyces mirabilis]